MAVVSLQAQTFSTRPFIPEVKTLRVVVDGDFMKFPVVDLRGKSTLEISFDYLADSQPWLAYRLVHCDAEWNEDNLSEMDFCDGFMPVKIEDVKPSFNTFISYYHCKIFFPNEILRLLVSGNYAVVVHQEDDEDEVVAVATFSVSEQLAFVSGEVSANTDVDFHKSNQQLSLVLSWSPSALPYLDVANEIRLMVCQNRRAETLREPKVPSRIESGRAIFEHNRDLIFPAGNNYRLFEFISERYASVGVDNVRYHAPYYLANLREDTPRADANFRYEQEQNGRFLVRALNVDDVSTEGEYFKAIFTLKADPRWEDRGGVYLSGDFTYGLPDEEFRLDYEDGFYRKEVLLKQGAYNYLYLVGGQTAPIEGDHYETENEYDVYVYYHPNGARYDRLLGVAKIE